MDPRQTRQQAEAVLHALRAQMRLAPEGEEQAPKPPATSVPPVHHFVVEMDRRWAIAGEPPGSSLPVVGPVITFLKQAMFRATRWYLRPILQQQVDFNAGTVRFAQRVDGELLDLRAGWGSPDPDAGEGDRALVEMQREAGALRVRLRYQQRLLEETQRQLRDAQEELRRLLRRLEHDRVPPPSVQAAGVPSPPPSRPALDYYGFEVRFRGTSDQVREHQRQYLPFFAGASEVLDIGCGRGEFLELLRDAGITCRGVDLDPDMVAAAREKGLDVTEGDALAYLRAREDGSLGGAFCAQLVEHLEPAILVELIHLLGRKLRSGAPLVIETINPQSLLAASSHFLLDLSHVRLVHPETLKFLLEGAGFSQVEVRYTSPVPEALQLEGVPWPDDGGPLDALCVTLNRNLAKLNSFLYGYQDYAVVGLRTED